MFGQSLLSAFGIACTTDTDQLFTTPTSTTSLATYQLNNATTSIPSNTYPGTASNITYAAGKFGNAAVFNGSNSEIVASSSITPSSGGFAISWWQKTTQADNTYSYTMDNGGGSLGNGLYIITHRTDVGLIIGFKNASTFGSASIPYSSAERTQWTHFCFSWDGTTTTNAFKIYKNNIATSFTSTVTNAGAAYPFRIGRSYNGTDYFGGSIDQVRIFNTALPQAAVTALYNETTTTATSASIDYQVANPNSVAYYKMSDATDQLGNYNGTATNVNFNTEGKFGFAGSFNGSSSKVDVTGSVPQDSSGVISISFWAKSSSTSRECFFIFQAPNPNAEFLKLENNGYQGSNSLRVTYNNSFSANINNEALSDGNWHHIVVTAGSGNLKTYKDGTLLATHSVTITDQTLDAFALGYRKYNNDLYFNGSIDQVRIYDAVLSAADVSTLYKEVECEPAAINALDQFNTVLYTGNGGTQSITGVGFETDVVWIKERSNPAQHALFDSVRGNQYLLSPNQTIAEIDQSANPALESFDTNGFTVDQTNTSNYYVNRSSQTYVAWNWKAPLANLSTGFNGSSTVGSASKIDLTGSTTLTTRSISLWVNLAGTGSGGNLILDNSDGQNPGVVQYGKWVIQLQYGGTNYFCWDTYVNGSYGICDVNYTFNLNTWYHIVFVAEANNQAVYINGVSQTLQNVSRAGDIGTVTMSTNRLGASWSTQYTHALNGTMGQVRIFNDALTASEVADLYAEPAASNNTLNYPAGAGCIAAYPLQTDAVDLSGNYSGASSNVTFGQPGYLTGNTDGTITSTVAANTEAGFSIVKYKGNQSNATIGHGLSLAPEMIIAKSTTVAQNWAVYHKDVGNQYWLQLNSSSAKITEAIWQNTTPTNSVFSLNGNVVINKSNSTNIAYCFTSIPGYSKIGSYNGTGASGNTIYIGFEPSFLIIKSTGVESWYVMDNKRLNGIYSDQLYANLTNAEGTGQHVDFITDGFKLDTTDGGVNNGSATYIFLAIA